MTFLFHKDVFMPPSAKSPVYVGKLMYSHHAIKEAQSDRYGSMTLPETFDPEAAELIESELSDDGTTVLKQVWRQALDENRDLVLVLTPTGRVKTVWINQRRDTHHTLQVNKYVRA